MSIVFSEPFKESIENKKKASSTTTTSSHNKEDLQNQNSVDRSDFLALRSVDDDNDNELEEKAEEVVGGVSNVPLFSSSEEKLLAYTSEQVNISDGDRVSARNLVFGF